jgi:hypothetical protein
VFDVLNAATGTLKYFAEDSLALGKRRGGPTLPCGRNCAAIFVIGLLGAIPGLLSRATTPSYVAFVICFLILAFTGLSPH